MMGNAADIHASTPPTPRAPVRRAARLLVRGACVSIASVWTFLTTCLLGAAIVFLVAWKVYGIVPVAVTSGSMEPVMPVNSLIFVKQVDADVVRVGDVITFDAPGERFGQVTHRVIKVTRRDDGYRYFETKGDANEHADDWSRYMPQPKAPESAKAGGGAGKQVTATWVPGVTYGDAPAVRYVWGVPYLGHLVKLSERPRLRAAILVGLLAAIALTLLVRIWIEPAQEAARRRRARERARRIAEVFDAAQDTRTRPHVDDAQVPAAAPAAESVRGHHEPSTIHVTIQSDAVVARILSTHGSVVGVHRVPVPELDLDAGPIATVIVNAFAGTSATVERMLPTPRFDGARVAIDPRDLESVLSSVAGEDRVLDTDALGLLVGRIAEDLRGSNILARRRYAARLARLVVAQSLLSHLQVERARILVPGGSTKAGLLARVGNIAAVSTIVVLLTAFNATASQATLTDLVQMGAVDVTGDQLLPTTSMSFTSASGGASSNLQTSWTTPTNITPTSYDFWRSTSPAVDTSGAPTANVASSPWTVSLAQCSVYYYKSKSRYMSMVSAESAEFSWMHDGTAPVIARSHLEATSGIDPVAGWVRPGHPFYLYAQVTDNCAPANSISVTFDVSNLVAGGSTTAAGTFGAYSPSSSVDTYNFRVGPLTADATLTDGENPAWSMAAQVPATWHSQTDAANGAAPNVDGTAPTVPRTPNLVADKTNYFDPEVGSGAVSQGLAFRLVGSFADSGVGLHAGAGGSVANTSNISTSATADLSATGGPFSTENGIDDWTHRTPVGGSAPVAQNPIANGSYAISIVTQDRLGNSVTSNITGRVDSTRPSASSCTNFNGNVDNPLDGGDRTRLSFSEAIDPGSVVDGWTDGTSTVDGLAFEVWNSQFLGLGVLVPDFLYYGGTRIQASANQADGYDLGSADWYTGLFGGGHSDFTNGTVERLGSLGGTGWDLHYLGAGAPSFARPGGLDPPDAETFKFLTAGEGIWDVAGNNLSTASVGCATIGW